MNSLILMETEFTEMHERTTNFQEYNKQAALSSVMYIFKYLKNYI